MHSEKRLYILARAGDKEAFGEILKTHYQFAFRVAFKILLDEEETKDVLQDVFIKVWQKFNLYNPRQKFTTWLYKIIVNQCYDVLRKKKRSHAVPLNELNTAVTTSIENEYQNCHLIEFLKSRIDQLPVKQRMVFLLRDFEDLSIAEIASQLKISKDAVKANLYLARKWARSILKKVDQ